MTATIRAIETSYAGCRFRSRLEARWAVFFDALNIRWEYEPQGFYVGLVGRAYLPDFYLVDHNLWVEVKGSVAAIDFGLMLDAIDFGEGLPRVSHGEGGLLLLSDIHRPNDFIEPVFPLLSHTSGVRLDFWNFATNAAINSPSSSGWSFSAHGADVETPKEVADALQFKFGVKDPKPTNWARAKARSARFEHGQTPS